MSIMIRKINQLMKKTQISEKVRKVILKTIPTKKEQKMVYQFLKESPEWIDDHIMLQKIFRIKGFIKPMSEERKQEALNKILNQK